MALNRVGKHCKAIFGNKEGEQMIQVSDYVDVRKRAQELDCNMPESITLLPRNFENARSKNELVYETTTPTVRTLWRQNDITENALEKPEDRFPLVIEDSFEWIGPIIFVSSSIISQNPHSITVALNVISNYLTGWFKGIPRRDREAKLSIVVETKDMSYRKMEYEGPPEGLKDLPPVIKEMGNE